MRFPKCRGMIVGPSHPFFWRGVVIQVIEGVFHPRQTTGQGQQEVDHFVKVANKHLEFVKLIWLADFFHNGLYLLPQDIVCLDVFQKCLPCFSQHLQLPTNAVNKFLLRKIKEMRIYQHYCIFPYF